MPRKKRAEIVPETPTPPAPTPVAVAEQDDAGDPVSPDHHGEEGEDFSELEVQQMLEARDQAGDTEAPLVPGAAPVPPPEPPVLAPDELHALDHAPKNSKIVVTDEGAVLATPGGVHRLPTGDPAHLLPRGARIFKRGDQHYVATQLNATVTIPDLETPTAALAITQFVPQFHPDGAPRP